MIARAIRAADPSVRVVFAGVSPGHGGELVAPEFEWIPLTYRRHRDEDFADRFEQVIRTVAPSLVCLDLSPVPWLYLVRFPEIPRAYVTNFFLTDLMDFETHQVRHLAANRDALSRRRSRRGLAPLDDAKSLYRADAVLLCDPPALARRCATVTEPYHLTGPCVWQPAASDGQRAPTGRYLFVTLGSTGRSRLPKRQIERLRRRLDCASTAWVLGDGHVRRPGKHDLVLSNVPLDSALRGAELAVTHGGAGSTYAALCEGVPVAVSPAHRNHEILGEVLAGAGIGTLLNDLAGKDTADVRERVDEMRRQLGRLGLSTPGDAEAQLAANILLSMT